MGHTYGSGYIIGAASVNVAVNIFIYFSANSCSFLLILLLLLVINLRTTSFEVSTHKYRGK